MKAALKQQAQKGFTLVEIMIVVAILGILVGMGVIRFMRARDYARLNTIYSNLRTVETAKEQWALDNKKTNGDPIPDVSVLTNYFRHGALNDVMQEQYVPNDVGTPSHAALPPGVGLGPWPAGSVIPAP